MQIDYKQAADFVSVCDNVHILTHQSPDGDTLGSAFALHFALSKLGKKSVVLCPDEIPERYAFLYNPLVNMQENFTPDCVIAVDLADTGLMGNMRKIYENKVDLCIDHHISNTMYAANTLVNPDASATCEVMYSLFAQLVVKIDDNIARCLYTGIATDTGCFKYSNTTAEAHRICSELIQFNIDFASINREMFDIKSKSRFYLEQHIVDHMEYYFGGKCALLCITKELCSKLKVDMEDLDGVASIPLQIEGTEVSVTFKEKESGIYKISMRSANSINVSHICQYLGGGGHIKAAGCIVRGTYEEARKQVLDAVGMVLGGK